MTSRADVRSGISVLHRITLLENDADEAEAAVIAIQTTLSRLVWVIATASIGLAVNAALLIAAR